MSPSSQVLETIPVNAVNLDHTPCQAGAVANPTRRIVGLNCARDFGLKSLVLGARIEGSGQGVFQVGVTACVLKVRLNDKETGYHYFATPKPEQGTPSKYKEGVITLRTERSIQIMAFKLDRVYIYIYIYIIYILQILRTLYHKPFMESKKKQ